MGRGVKRGAGAAGLLYGADAAPLRSGLRLSSEHLGRLVSDLADPGSDWTEALRALSRSRIPSQRQLLLEGLADGLMVSTDQTWAWNKMIRRRVLAGLEELIDERGAFDSGGALRPAPGAAVWRRRPLLDLVAASWLSTSELSDPRELVALGAMLGRRPKSLELAQAQFELVRRANLGLRTRRALAQGIVNGIRGREQDLNAFEMALAPDFAPRADRVTLVWGSPRADHWGLHRMRDSHQTHCGILAGKDATMQRFFEAPADLDGKHLHIPCPSCRPVSPKGRTRLAGIWPDMRYKISGDIARSFSGMLADQEEVDLEALIDHGHKLLAGARAKQLADQLAPGKKRTRFAECLTGLPEAARKDVIRRALEEEFSLRSFERDQVPGPTLVTQVIEGLRISIDAEIARTSF